MPKLDAEEGAKRLVGKKVLDLQRRGKYLWWVLKSESPATPDEFAIFHFGMTGSYKVYTVSY